MRQSLPSAGWLWQGLAAFAICMTVASLLYHGVERPLAKLRRRFSKVGAAPAPLRS